MSAGPLVATDDRDRELALARLAVAGDERAFARIYAAHSARVFALCVRMCGSRQRAGELTQDVFVHVWERLATWRGESALSSWIYRLTVNLVLSNARADSRRQKHEMPDDAWDAESGELGAGSRGPRAEGREREAESRGPRTENRVLDALDLEQAIAGLPEGARTVFVLHDIEGYRHNEIAAMTGTAEGTCRAQLHRARKLLIEALNR